MKLLVLFIILNIFNVVLQTVKSLCTIKCGKAGAAVVNALAYGFYTVILVYMNCDLSLMQKCFVVGGCNLVGVYVVKLFEEKTRKDKLWKIEMTVPQYYLDYVADVLDKTGIPYSVIATSTDKYNILNIYCATQKQSEAVREITKKFKVKYFVTESKTL